MKYFKLIVLAVGLWSQFSFASPLSEIKFKRDGDGGGTGTIDMRSFSSKVGIFN